jgi:hypothetical protein
MPMKPMKTFGALAWVALATLSGSLQAQEALPVTTSAMAGETQTSTASGPMDGAQSARPLLSFGIGYPDLRIRGKLWGPLDSELKFAFDNESQAYSLRLYATCWTWQRLDVNVGVEGGAIRFAGIDTLTGDGAFWEPFAGLAYQVSRLIGLTAEVGPAFMRVSADGVSVASTNTVITTAIYFRLF